MAVLILDDIKKSYGFTEVLDCFSMSVNEGEKVALIGPNGSGKSTIFKIMNKQEEFSEGKLSIRNDIEVGCLQQIPNFNSDNYLWSELKKVFEDIINIKKQLNKLEKKISSCGEDIRDYDQTFKKGDQIKLKNNKNYNNKEKLELLLKKYSDLREEFEEKDGYEYKSKIRQVAIGLGFTHQQLNQKVKTLSGGEKTRLGLVQLLLKEPDLLLLDEPTNHLDISSIQWLEAYLSNKFEGSVIIISHDRYFLDEVVERIVELKNGDSEIYHGNYSYYLKERKKRYEQRLKEYRNQQKKIKQMEDAIERLRRWGKQGDNPRFFKRAKSMEKELKKMNKIEKPTLGGKKFNLDLEINKRSGDEVLKIRDLYFSYNNNNNDNNGNNLINGLDLDVYWQDKIGIVGDNGCGKTTLLKLIVNQITPDKGQIEIGASVKAGYYTQEFDGFNPEDEVLTAFRKTVSMKTGKARNVLATFLFTGDEVFKKVGNLSGGEKRRLRLLQLMQGNYNLLILDEPTNHLDLPAREVLEEALNNYPGTVVIVSHDRYFLNKSIDFIYELENGTLSKYYGNYDHYRQKKEQKQKLKDNKSNKSELNNQDEKKQKSDYFKLKQKSKEKRKKKRKINKLEDSIMEIEDRKKELEEEMIDPENLNNFQLLNELKQEYEKLDKKLKDLYHNWENLI